MLPQDSFELPPKGHSYKSSRKYYRFYWGFHRREVMFYPTAHNVEPLWDNTVLPQKASGWCITTGVAVMSSNWGLSWGKAPFFVEFVNFRGVNIPLWPFSNYQCDITELNVENEKTCASWFLQAIVGWLQHTTAHYQRSFSLGFFNAIPVLLSSRHCTESSLLATSHGNFHFFSCWIQSLSLFSTLWNFKTCSEILRSTSHV